MRPPARPSACAAAASCRSGRAPPPALAGLERARQRRYARAHRSIVILCASIHWGVCLLPYAAWHAALHRPPAHLVWEMSPDAGRNACATATTYVILVWWPVASRPTQGPPRRANIAFRERRCVRQAAQTKSGPQKWIMDSMKQKLKTHKATAKRVRTTGSGKFMHLKSARTKYRRKKDPTRNRSSAS